MRGIDVNSSVLSYSGALVRDGILAVGRYLGHSTKKDPFTLAEARHGSAQGLKWWTIDESGWAEKPEYYTEAQATTNAANALLAAREIEQPTDRPTYFAIDCDLDIPTALAYFRVLHLSEFHQTYPVGGYASDAVLRALSEAGYASYFWRAYSGGGWAGSDNPFLGWHIRQGPPQSFYGALDADTDECRDGVDFGAWLAVQPLTPGMPGME